jgi:replication-associated recombination protein RarA
MTPALFKELCQRADGKFIPQSADDFIGIGSTHTGSAAKAIAQQFEKIVDQAKACGNAPIKVLLNGQPGIGKTGLGLYLQKLIGCTKFSTTKTNGTQMKIELIDDIARGMQYSNLFGDYRLIHCDEADEVPRVAQVRFLSVLDDLPDGVAVVCTSNCKLKDFENRFQTRFQVFEVIPPETSEIVTLLTRFIDARSAEAIAKMSFGNVRAALLDAKGVMQQMMPKSTLVAG